MLNKPEDFGEDYFNGKGSNYKNYIEKKFDQLAADLILVNQMETKDKIFDFGCAAGGLLAEFKKRGFTRLSGTDISEWALDHGRREYSLPHELKPFALGLLNKKYDWVIMLDVLEHINTADLFGVFYYLSKADITKGIIVRIPVTADEGEDFVLDISKNDKTHIQRHCKRWWEAMMNIAGYKSQIAINMPSIYESDGVMCRRFIK